MAISGGAVVVAGPAGYCIDRGGSRDAAGGSGAFVLLASCASVTRSAQAKRPIFPALLTATVADQPDGSPPVAAQTAALRRYFASPAGRAALARDGNPASIEIVQTLTRDGFFIVHARDRTMDDTPGLAEDHWRAIFDLGGQIVSASVLGLSGQPISDDAGLATVLEFAQRIRRESTGRMAQAGQ